MKIKNSNNGININDKIYFYEEKRPYIVKAVSDRHIICTKPFNLKKTCLYTIIDLLENKRAPNNLVFNIYDYMIKEDIEQCMDDLINGEIGLSIRRGIDLNIVRIN